MSDSTHTREYQIFLIHLRAARERAGLTQRELAERLEKSYSYVAKVETGYTRMDIYQISCYLKAVGTPFRDFMLNYIEAIEQEDSG